MKFILRFVQLCIWVGVILFFGYIGYKNFAPIDVSHTKTFDQPNNNAFVSDFTPGTRVDGLNTLKKDPVYMHVRSPRSFEFMYVQFPDQPNIGKRLRLGIQVGESRSSFSLHDWQEVNDYFDGYIIPLRQAYRDAERRYTLIYSFDDNEPLEVGDVEITFSNK